MNKLSCFTSYDVRGKVPTELNEDIAYRIGRAYAAHLKPSTVALGYDIRLTSPLIYQALANGLVDSGVDVINLGLCGTEEVYFAAFNEEVEGGICITASHNPKDYNGMKFVGENAKPISRSNGLNEIENLTALNQFTPIKQKGKIIDKISKANYIDHLSSYIDIKTLKPLKVVVNAGNGGVGAIIDLLEPHLPFDFIKLHHNADGHFPNGVPNPLLEENRRSTQQAVIDHNADLGIAWDGDFDRCFFFDETGAFIDGYYIVGLLASELLKSHENATIIYDPRLYWNTIEMVTQAGGKAVKSKTGHTFMKEAMRRENAIYGGEMSAHHYFKHFAFCDNGTIPWLFICQLLSQSNTAFSTLVSERQLRYPCSGEINLSVVQPASILSSLEQHFQNTAVVIDHTDGLSIEFEQWRFNVRMSNTEPLLRVNAESKSDKKLLEENVNELLLLINKFDH